MKTSILSFGLCGGLLLAGCGRERAPDPPDAYSQLVIGMFDSLQKKQYRSAAEKTGKLKALDTENVFLNQLQEDGYSSEFIVRAQPRLDAGKPDEALKIIMEGRRQYPFNRNLVAAENLLKSVIELCDRLHALAKPESSERLKDNIAAIRKISKQCPDAEMFLPLLKEKSDLADRMALREARRARFYLLCDERELRSQNDVLAETLKALFEADNAAASGAARLPYDVLPGGLRKASP